MDHQQAEFDRSLETVGYAMVKNNGLCPAEFYWDAKKITPADGPVRFEKVEMIRFYLAGGDTTARLVHEQDKYEYARQYAIFKNSGDQSAVGWSLAQVPWLDAAQIATYKAMNITTMEALAAAPDTTIQGIMGGLKHREQAKAALDAMAGQEPMLKLAAEKEAMQQQVDLQAAQIKELCDKIEEMKTGTAPKKKGGFTPVE